MLGTKKPFLNRKTAVSAEPVIFPPKKTERKNGKLYVTVEFERPRWQRVLGAYNKCERTFGLDEYGQEIYSACDGSTSVKKMIKTFASKHHLNIAEAEVSVTTFLKTLMMKGLVCIPISEREIIGAVKK